MPSRVLCCLLAFTTGVAGAASALVRLFGPELIRAGQALSDPGDAPERVLPALVTLASAGGLLLALAWLGCSVVLCAVEALHDAARGARPAQRASSFLRPRAVRLLVGAALGTTVTALVPAAHGAASSAVTTPLPSAVAAPGHGWTTRLDGLPLPDRTTGCLPTSAPPPAPTAPSAAHRVRPGESLWIIAARSLPANASAARVDATWRRLYAANRATVGADPDLLLPGTVLRLPAALSTDDPGVSR